MGGFRDLGSALRGLPAPRKALLLVGWLASGVNRSPAWRMAPPRAMKISIKGQRSCGKGIFGEAKLAGAKSPTLILQFFGTSKLVP